MQIAISILTIFASGVIAAAVTYFLNASKEHAFFMRKKAEDLYIATDKHERAIEKYFSYSQAFLRG